MTPETAYDSRADTLAHIRRVNDLLLTVCHGLLARAKGQEAYL